MRSRPIRILAIVIAAVLALGSFSIWAVSTQERASVSIGEIYEVEIESNEELNNILEQTSGSSGGIEEDKDLFDIFPNEDYPRDHMSGSLHLYNADEVEQHLNSLTIEFEAEGQIIGNLTLRNGGFSFRIEEDDGWDEVSLDTTGSGSYTRKEDADQFDLHFMIQIDEVQQGVVSEEDITEERLVELEIGSTSGGSVVEPGEGSFEYEEGTVVDLDAIAEEDTSFVEWSGDIETIGDPTSNQTTIEMLDDYSITAVFDVEVYELTIDSTEGGSVVEPGEGSFEYEEGTVVDLEAMAEDGYVFYEWTGDIETIDDPTSDQTPIEVLDHYSITAEFLEEPFFEVEIVDYDDPVIEGQTLEVYYTVTNTGEIEDTQDIEFTVEDEDGDIVRSVTDNEVTLGPGETYDETFTWTTDGEDAGEYDATVASEDDDDSITVTVIEPPAQLYPVEELTTDNLEGDIEYLQHDPESDDAYDNWYEAVDNEDTELEVAMDSPENELSGEQTLGFLLRRTDNSGRTPDVTIELYQDGELIDTLAEGLDITDTEGEVHYFNFDAADLNDLSGEDITLELTGDRTGGHPGDRNTIEYGAIEWEVNTVGTNSDNVEETTSRSSGEEIQIERNIHLLTDQNNIYQYYSSKLRGGAADVHIHR